jgi:hypothetical protein
MRPLAKNSALRRLVSGRSPGKSRAPRGTASSWSCRNASAEKTGWEKMYSAPASIFFLSGPADRGARAEIGWIGDPVAVDQLPFPQLPDEAQKFH